MTAFSKLLSCAAEAAVTERVLRQRVVLFISWYSHTVVSPGCRWFIHPPPSVRCEMTVLENRPNIEAGHLFDQRQVLKRSVTFNTNSCVVYQRTCSRGSHRGKTTWLLITMERRVMSRRLIQFIVQIARYFLGLVQPWSQKRCKTVYWQQSTTCMTPLSYPIMMQWDVDTHTILVRNIHCLTNL